MKKLLSATIVILVLVAISGRLAATPDVRAATTVALDAPSPLPPRVVLPGIVFSPSESYVIWAQNTGTERSTVTVAYFNQDGSPVANGIETRTVPAGNHIGFPTSGIPAVPSPFRGLAVLYSDGPVVAVARHWSYNLARPGAVSVSPSYPFSSEAGAVVSLPYIANALDGTYNTLLTIANTGNSTACVQVAYSFVPGAGSVDSAGRGVLTDAGPGGSGCSAGYPIAANGQLTLGPSSGAIGVTAMPAGTRNSLMSATVTSTGAPVAASVFAYLSGGLAKGEWYGGFFVQTPLSGAARTDDLGTEIAIPIALKTSDGYYSQILMSNPNPVPAAVTIDYAGSSGKYSVSMMVPANGVANHGVYSDDTVPVGFVGAATIHSSQPIAAVVFRSKMTSAGTFVDQDLYTAMNGVPLSKGSTKLYFPYVVRRHERDTTHDGRNSWVSVAVVGGGTANLTLSTVASGQTIFPSCPFSGTLPAKKTITGSFVFYLNLDQDNGLGSNPDCVIGAMTITSDVPIIAVADIINDNVIGDQEGGYNAIRGN